MKSNNSTFNAFILIILAAFLGASVPVMAKIALQIFATFTLVFLRFFFASLVMVPFFLKQISLKKDDVRKLLMIGIAGATNPIFLFIALKFTKASVAPLIYASIPTLTMVYLSIFEKRKISSFEKFGILLGLFGVCMVVFEPILRGNSSPGNVLGNSLIFMAAIGFTYYGILSKKAPSKITPKDKTFAVTTVTLLLSIPLMILEIVNAGIPTGIEIQHVLSALYLGIGGTALYYFVYQKALSVGNEISASLFTYLQPIFTAILAFILLGEHLTPIVIIGGISSIIGAKIASSK